MPNNQLNDVSLRLCASHLRDAAEKAGESPPRTSILEGLHSLAASFVAAAELCELVSSNRDTDLAGLFDGGEQCGPNIYTRMRCIRDLCSAASWSLQVRESGIAKENDIQLDWAWQKPAAEFWHALVRDFGDTPESVVTSEMASLLDDVLEALLYAGQLLVIVDSAGGSKWAEIQRHIDHVRDHFDYAESYVLASLRPGVER